MKRKVLLGLLAVVLPMSVHAADSYTLDPTHSYPNFSINHMGFSNLHGRFDKTTGKVTLDRAAKTGSIEVNIEAASISTGFGKRDEHLRSPDFFNTAEFPTITFKSNKIVFKGDTPASVDGNLTIMGLTKPVKFTITYFKCGQDMMSKKEKCGADATAQIKRSDFGMRFALPAVGDEVNLVFGMEAVKD